MRLGARGYDILVGAGILESAGQIVASVCPLRKKLIVITNSKVAALYGRLVIGGLKTAGYAVSVVEVPVGERYKSLATADKLYGRFLEFGADRSTVVVALGGGVIGDLAGFVAATFMRGLEFIQIPTTLLAQVDSSVGGKTAVNHRLAKNIIGAFHQPKLVISDPLALETLPGRELRAGLSEVIKYALIGGGKIFDAVRAALPLHGGPDGLTPVIVACCRFKAEVVAGDERDLGGRAILNYGHTIGHALEAVAGYRRYNHGEAVAVGMIGAARISNLKGLMGAADVQVHHELIGDAGLPQKIENIDIGLVYNHLQHDKKRVGGGDRLVLLAGIGRPRVVEIESGLIKKTLGGLSGGDG